MAGGVGRRVGLLEKMWKHHGWFVGTLLGPEGTTGGFRWCLLGGLFSSAGWSLVVGAGPCGR